MAAKRNPVPTEAQLATEPTPEPLEAVSEKSYFVVIETTQYDSGGSAPPRVQRIRHESLFSTFPEATNHADSVYNELKMLGAIRAEDGCKLFVCQQIPLPDTEKAVDPQEGA